MVPFVGAGQKEAGVDLRDAQRLMRHSDPKLTATVYTDLRVQDLRTAAEKLLSKHGSSAGREQKIS